MSIPWLNNPSNTLTNLRELESQKDQRKHSRSNEEKADINEGPTQNEWELNGLSLLEVLPLSKSNQVETLHRQARDKFQAVKSMVKRKTRQLQMTKDQTVAPKKLLIVQIWDQCVLVK